MASFVTRWTPSLGLLLYTATKIANCLRPDSLRVLYPGVSPHSAWLSASTPWDTAHPSYRCQGVGFCGHLEWGYQPAVGYQGRGSEEGVCGSAHRVQDGRGVVLDSEHLGRR